MRPTERFGTFSRTSGGVEVDADTAEEIVVAVIEEFLDDGVVEAIEEVLDGGVIEATNGEELVDEYAWGMNERKPSEATSVRKIK
jgi:hypothetical protein